MKASLCCHLFIGFSLAFLSSALAQSVQAHVYIDPQQRFSIQLAPGWTARPAPESNICVIIAGHPEAYLLVLVEKGTDTEDLLEHASNKTEKQFPGYGISKRGSGNLAGQPTKTISAVAKSPNGIGAAVINIEAFAAGGYTYCALYYASGDTLADSRTSQETDKEEGMLKTLKAGSLAHSAARISAVPANSAPSPPVDSQSASPDSSSSGSTYIDPQQLFTIQVHPGWMAKSFDGGGASGVTLVHGAGAYLQIIVQAGTGPAVFLKSLNDNMQKQLPNYHMNDHGTRTLAGQSSSFITGVSQAPPGTHYTLVYLETLGTKGYTCAAVSSSDGESLTDPQMLGDFNESQDMIKTLTVGARGPQAAATAVLPASKTPAPAAQTGAAASNTPSTELSPTDKKKLAVLDAALNNGAITKDEYVAKRNALYASAVYQQSNAAKLKAIEKAYRDGILTKEEYERKKDELTSVSASRVTPTPNGSDSRSSSGNALNPSLNTANSSPGRATTGWATHNDPAGFLVAVPAGWNVSRDKANGSVTILGQRGERVVIWPIMVGQQLDARGAAALLQQLVRKVDSEVSWDMPASSSNVVRAFGRGGQRSATALLSWASGTTGTTAYLYYVGATAELYRNSTDAFVGILRSFHIVQDPSLPNEQAQGNTAETSLLRFVGWNDPHEGAFSVSAPQGWQVIGGAYRLSATDIRYALTVASPDGLVRATIGDSNVGTFTQPTQMLALAGMREGGYQLLGDGTKLEIRRYASGQQFARSYIETFVTRQCTGLRIDSNNVRQDLALSFSQSARNEGFGSAQLTAGDVSFTCNLNGNAVQGKYVVATALLAPGQSPMWAVYRLYGYLASASRQQDGEKVVTEVMQSWKFNPQWEAQQKGIANAAVQQDNLHSQQLRSRALRAIAEDQRQTSEIITKGYEKRQQVYDEISRKRENSILGTLDVVDPQTGTQYKVSNYGDYHYMSNEGYIYSTHSPNSPGPNLRELITLP